MSKKIYFCIYAGVFNCLFACGFRPLHEQKDDSRKLVWSDEFTKDGLPDPNKWSYDKGDGCPDVCGWGNNEWQYYTTAQSKNARVQDGLLIIEAHKENIGSKAYSSARLVSKNKGDWTYGYIEVKAKLPKGKGVWPAIWMLPTDWEYGGWPRSGEIDIMEHVGYQPDSLYGSIHTGKYNHLLGTQPTKGVFSKSLYDEFHIYGCDWTPDNVTFIYDGQRYLTFNREKGDIDAWPFDKKFHLLLNIAVGGNWGGKYGVDENIWPQKMLVDYVRVYQIDNQ